VEHEAALALDGAAHVDGHLRRPRVGGADAHVLEDLAQAHLAWAVHHQPQGALLVVLADEGDGVEKVRVRELRHRDEEVTGQPGALLVHGHSIPPAPGARKGRPAGALSAR